jgi:hypothetical protein
MKTIVNSDNETTDSDYSSIHGGDFNFSDTDYSSSSFDDLDDQGINTITGGDKSDNFIYDNLLFYDDETEKKNDSEESDKEESGILERVGGLQSDKEESDTEESYKEESDKEESDKEESSILERVGGLQSDKYKKNNLNESLNNFLHISANKINSY